jgi:hypothetical protein
MNKSTDLYQTVKNNKNLKNSVSFSQLDEIIPLNNNNNNNNDDETINHYETLSFNDSNINTNLANSIFSKEWHSSKNLYLNIQISFIGINFLITLTLLSLSIWINIDRRFLLLSSIGIELHPLQQNDDDYDNYINETIWAARISLNP